MSSATEVQSLSTSPANPHSLRKISLIVKGFAEAGIPFKDSKAVMTEVAPASSAA
jgi:hypothetical protein